MPSKIPILISLAAAIVAGSALAPTTAFAETITSRGTKAWSIAEMQDLYVEAQAKKDDLCDKDPDCRRDLDFIWADEDPKYAALQAYSMSSFVLSAINPSKNTVRAYFRDLDPMALEMEGEERHTELTEAYVVWLEDTFDEYKTSFISEIRAGRHRDDMHEIYIASTEKNGANWFPAETEVEISAPDAELEKNTKGMIRLFALNAPSSVLSYVDYSDCLNSPDYQPGMECRLMYDETANRVYQPFVPADAKTETSDDQPSGGDDASNIADAGNDDSGKDTNPAPQDSTGSQEGATDDSGPHSDSNVDSSPSPALFARVETTSSTASTIAAPTTTSSNNTNNSSAPTTTSAAASQPLATSTDASAESSANSIEDGAEPLAAATTSVSTPLGGDSCDQNKTFPWWIVLLLILGDILVIWWLLPNRSRKTPKNA